MISRHAVNRDLQHATDRLASLKRGFHFGARPDIYGNEGEEPVVAGARSSNKGRSPALAKKCKVGHPCEEVPPAAK